MTDSIHALLLAAGLGTRLRPVTLTKPKCLVKIGGEPLLEKWLKKLESCSCNGALVNTHYLAEQVHKYIEKRPQGNMDVRCIFEPELLGTAGTLIANENMFKGSIGLLIHADNATDFDLRELIEAHKQRPKECILTMLTFDTDNPQSCGIVELDELGIVQTFHEKVKNPPGNRANGAVYAFNEDLIQEIKKLGDGISDMSKEVIPKLTKRIFTKHTTEKFIDIGTPSSLKKAGDIWKHKEQSQYTD